MTVNRALLATCTGCFKDLYAVYAVNFGMTFRYKTFVLKFVISKPAQTGRFSGLPLVIDYHHLETPPLYSYL